MEVHDRMETGRKRPLHACYDRSVLRSIDVKDECRKQIIVYQAASKLVTLNIEQTNRGSSCGLCDRPFSDDSEKENCLYNLRARLGVFECHQVNIQDITLKKYKTRVEADIKAANNLPIVRKGYSSYIRQVKQTCLTKKKCIGCKRMFSSAELGEFLSRLDRWSNILHNRYLVDEEDSDNRVMIPVT